MSCDAQTSNAPSFAFPSNMSGTASLSMPTVNVFTPWLAPPSIYLRFAMLLFDWWQQASFIQ